MNVEDFGIFVVFTFIILAIVGFGIYIGHGVTANKRHDEILCLLENSLDTCILNGHTRLVVYRNKEGG